MKRWWNLANLFGVCCSSLCFLGLPMLIAAIPVVGFAWLLNETLMRVMLIMFLLMFAVAAIAAFRVHHRWGPSVVTICGSLVLIGMTWHLFPKQAGWLALIGMTGAWFWDFRLLKKAHHEPMASHL